jgi:glycosyltransferase involved in cell wall biosynthesis
LENDNARFSTLKDTMAQDVKNILFINPLPVLYGAEMRLLDIIQNLDKSKFRPFVLLPRSGPFKDRLKELGIPVVMLDYNFKITRNPASRFFQLTKDFVHLARQHQIHLIHVNLHFRMSNLWLAFLMLRKPVIVQLRSHYWFEIFEKFVICRTTKAICISQAVERAFLKQRPSSVIMHHRSGHTQVVYDGIDVNHFCPKQTGGSVRQGLNVDQNNFLVALIGAIDPIKGQDVFVRAAKIVLQKYPQTKFIMAGALYDSKAQDTPYRSELLKYIKENNLNDNVILTGFRKDVDALMNAINLLVQPSQREALGTSMIEAMSCGKPVIGTKIDGIPEVIGENEAGILLNPRTPEVLAEAIIFFIEHPDEAVRRGLKGRERVLAKFNVFQNVKHLEGIYLEALKQ